jgi:endonuclease/exonuclease/phosphatase family metal-dependent hydrolase
VRLKLINLNIWLGGILLDNAIKFLKDENPDILTLQEVHSSKDDKLPRNFRTVSEIVATLGYKEYFFDPTFIKVLNGLKAESGNAIFSKFPIVKKGSYDLGGKWGQYDEADGNFELLPRKLQHAVINAGNTKLNIFNTQGIWGKDGRDNPERLKMSRIILEAVGGKQNVILTGDFNANPDTKTMQSIEEELGNVFKGELITSFNLKHKTDPAFSTAVVDMVFVSLNLKVVKHYPLNVDISDHLPLVVVFEV